MREHLAGCAQCRRAAANVEAISGMTRAAPYHRAPEGLAARIAAALPPAAQAHSAQDASNTQRETQGAAAASAGGRLRGLRWFWPLSGIGAGAGGISKSAAPGRAAAAGVPAAGLAWFACAVLIVCALSGG